MYVKNGLIVAASAGDSAAAHAYQNMEKLDPIAIILGIVGIVNVVAVCLFIYHAGRNVYDYYNGSMRYTPGWMVGWFFIPFAQIVMAYLANRELSKASNAMIKGHESSTIESEKPHGAMQIWGLLWSFQMLIGYSLGIYMVTQMGTFAKMQPDEIEIYRFTETFYLSLVTNILAVFSGIALLMYGSKMVKEHNAFRLS